MDQGKYDGLDVYIPNVGTVRECIDCAALIRGGPTRCLRCAKTWIRVGDRINGVVSGAWWSLYWKYPTLRKVVSAIVKWTR